MMLNNFISLNYYIITSSLNFANNIPNVFVKNDVNNGFNGGSCSRKLYKLSKVLFWLTIRSFNVGI